MFAHGAVPKHQVERVNMMSTSNDNVPVPQTEPAELDDDSTAINATPKWHIEHQLIESVKAFCDSASYAEKRLLKDVLDHVNELYDHPYWSIYPNGYKGLAETFLVQAFHCVLDGRGFFYSEVPPRVAQEYEDGNDAPTDATIPIRVFMCACRFIAAAQVEEAQSQQAAGTEAPHTRNQFLADNES